MKNISEMGVNSFLYITVNEEIVESRQNNSKRGKTERDVKLKLN